MTNIKDKRGRFFIAAELINDFDLMKKVFSNVVIVKAEMIFISNRFEYHAMSPMFEEISPCSVLPEYRVIFDSDGKCLFERIK